MNIFRTFLTAATLALASTAALAENSGSRTFERDGVVYEYTATEKDGKTILRGTADGRSFKLIVANNRVRGTMDGKFISFAPPAPKTAKTADTATIAAR